jgi:hypothetical protein
MYDLSVLIPARREQFLAKTVQDLLEHSSSATEIIVVLDGEWADPPLTQHPRVTVIYHPESVGQRAATNEAARLSSAKYVMKVDAHCAFAPDFDRVLLADMQDDITMVPVMRNLHVFDWVCENGHHRYQSPSGPCDAYWACPNGHQRSDSSGGRCPKCGQECTRREGCRTPTHQEIIWDPKTNPSSRSYCFDPEPHFQYFGDFSHRPEGRGDLTPSMSLQGSCFLMTRERYHALNVCDEAFGSWGSQGIEVACKTWLSGGRVMVNQKTWYAHCFRTQGGDFGFPYPQSGKQVGHAKKYAKDLFFNNKWPLQVHPLSWLVDKFWPVPYWTDADREALHKADANLLKPQPSAQRPEPTRAIIYYTDGRLDRTLAEPVRAQLQKISQDKGLPIVSASPKHLDFGVKNVHFPSLKPGHLTMFKQILATLEHSTADYVYFCEHDVIYHPTHFDFVPPTDDRYYYNTNVWQVRADDGHCLYYFCRKLSQMCCSRQLALEHFRKKIKLVEANDGQYDAKLGFEPGTRSLRQGGVDDTGHGDFRSAVPNIDIRHSGTLSKSKWSQSDFRNPANNIDWTESNSVPGWGEIEGRYAQFLKEFTIAITHDQKATWDRLALERAPYYTLGHVTTEDEYRQTGAADYKTYFMDDPLLRAEFPDFKQVAVVDIGCGIGRMTEFMARGFRQAYGTDISPEMIRQAKVRLGGYTNLEFYETDGNTLPLADNSVELAYSHGVYQSVKTFDMLTANFAAAHRVLKPGGIFKVMLRSKKPVRREYWWTGVQFDTETAPLLYKPLGFELLKQDYRIELYPFWLWLRAVK